MAQVDPVEFFTVDGDVVDGRLVGVDEDIVAGFQDFGGGVVDRVGDGLWQRSWDWWARGEVHFQAAVVGLADGQEAAGGAEADFGGFGLDVVEDGVGAGEGGVAAEVHLDVRGEPTQAVVGFGIVWCGDDVGGLGDGHFLGHSEHPLVFRPARQGDHAGGVAAERVLGKGVDSIAGQAHFFFDSNSSIHSCAVPFNDWETSSKFSIKEDNSPGFVFFKLTVTF